MSITKISTGRARSEIYERPTIILIMPQAPSYQSTDEVFTIDIDDILLQFIR